MAVDQFAERPRGGLSSGAVEHEQEREYRLGLVPVNVGRLPAEAPVPAKRRLLEARVIVVGEEKDELERLGEPDVREVASGGERVGPVVGVERAAEAGERMALRRHERMFA
jgi:hypothetical protein